MAPSTRVPLSRDRAVAVAVGIADAQGLAAVTMRSVARGLGVEAMSLYHHVRGKDDLLDGMVDAVFDQVDLPRPGEDWRDGLRRRSHSSREVLARHRWAVGLLDSRHSPGPATLRHHDAVLGTLRRGGFSPAAAAHAFALLDAFTYGFALQETNLPGPARGGTTGDPAEAGDMLAAMSLEQLPHLAWLVTEHVLQPGYDFGEEFGIGLEVVLDGMDRLRAAG